MCIFRAERDARALLNRTRRIHRTFPQDAYKSSSSSSPRAAARPHSPSGTRQTIGFCMANKEHRHWPRSGTERQRRVGGRDCAQERIYASQRLCYQRHGRRTANSDRHLPRRLSARGATSDPGEALAAHTTTYRLRAVVRH